MERRWLRDRRDAWVDHALGYTVVPAVLVVLFVVTALPPTVLAGLAGLTAGIALADIKKFQNRSRSFIGKTRFSLG